MRLVWKHPRAVLEEKKYFIPKVLFLNADKKDEEECLAFCADKKPMQTDTIQIQQIAAATGSSSVLPVTALASSAAPENYGAGAFGPAYVREGPKITGGDMPTYGPDGVLRSGVVAPGEEQLVDARAIKALEARDRQVRQDERAKGEAVGSSNFIYQIGPDGKKYAIGTGSHAVRPEDPSGLGKDENARSLSAEDKELLQKLQARDAKVRSHETAHIMAAGGQAHGTPTYIYQTGPDGRRYAIGGSVNISMLKTGDAEHDARQARTAYRAAMATGEPSPHDMQAAMRARLREMEAAASLRNDVE